MANTYTVQPGDTLWGIYGPNWKQLSGYTGDPTQLQIGTVLPAPPTTGTAPPVQPAGPSTALDVQDEQPIDVGGFPPADTNSVENIQTSTAGLGAPVVEEADTRQTQVDTDQKKIEELLGVKPGESLWGKLWEILKGKPEVDTQKIIEDLWEEHGITDLLEDSKQQALKIAKLQGDLDRLGIMELTEIDRARNQVANIPTYIIDRQTTAIQREYAIQKAYKSAELGAEAAVLQALNGNLQNARALVGDIVDAAVYDLTQKRADFDNMFNFFGNWISSLEDKQQQILVDARNEAIRQEDIAREETYWKLEQMIENPKAGIKTTDTLEQVAEKVGQAAGVTTTTQKWYNPDSGQVYFGSTPPAGNWINYGTTQTQGTGDKYYNTETGEEYDSWGAARAIIQTNPSASENELVNAIRENIVDNKGNPVFSVSDAQRIAREELAKVKIIDRDWLTNTMWRTQEELEQAARDAGYVEKTGGFFGIGAKEKVNTEKFLSDIMKRIESDRALGLSDQEIIKKRFQSK